METKKPFFDARRPKAFCNTETLALLLPPETQIDNQKNAKKIIIIPIVTEIIVIQYFL